LQCAPLRSYQNVLFTFFSSVGHGFSPRVKQMPSSCFLSSRRGFLVVFRGTTRCFPRFKRFPSPSNDSFLTVPVIVLPDRFSTSSLIGLFPLFHFSDPRANPDCFSFDFLALSSSSSKDGRYHLFPLPLRHLGLFFLSPHSMQAQAAPH